MLIGASYYSECWPAERWPIDARLMAEAGLNVVRMGEFAWSRFQPTPERLEFSWMDECIAHMRANGLRTLLGTPTRVAPPWLVALDRSMLIVNVDGSRAAYGGRYEFCLNHPTFREAAAELVRAMARHYRDEEGVLAWHLDNEYGVGICYCDRCAVAFQRWLRQRYGSLADLNRRWGTVYWSTEYTDWDQIDTPRRTENRQNPAVYLDYRRFFSDVTIGFARMTADLIRATGDRRPLVSNLHSGLDPHNLDYHALAEFLDPVATNNNFPHTDSGQMNLDLTHGLKRKPFWVVEQRVSGGGVPVMTPISRPGDVRRWTYLAIGHGADAVMYWAWRQYQLGQEQYWGGILEHDGEPGRFYDEVRQTCEELAHLAPFLDGTDVVPDVGFLNTYDSRWALDVELNHPDLAYERLAFNFWKPLRDRAITCEFTHPHADLGRYRLVIAPTLLLIDQATVAALCRYVEGGGLLVLTVRCGVKDPSNTIAAGDLLEAWRALTGARVAEYSPLAPVDQAGRLHSSYEEVEISWSRAVLGVNDTQHGPLQTIRPVPGFLRADCYPVRTWMEILEPRGPAPIEERGSADVLATYGADYCAGQAAIVRHRLGRGQVLTLGTLFERGGQRDLVDWLLAEAGLHRPIETTDGIEALVRRGPRGNIVILLNHTAKPHEICLPSPMRDLLAADGQERAVGETAVIPARGVRVLSPSEDLLPVLPLRVGSGSGTAARG
ncbi:MAG: beta-galactosidase [Chloroflexi bacterium]|nr:beta-galactosidase [Chloroflexota bacterium]